MRHEQPEPIAKKEAEAAFASDDQERRAYALLAAALHETDWRWVQGWCLKFLRGNDVPLRGLAITCIGHLARIHRQLDLDLVVPVLLEIKKEHAFSGRVDDALDDIATYVRKS